jgi:hypothetical protein
MKLYGVHVGAKRSVPAPQQRYGSPSFVAAAHPLPSALPRPPSIRTRWCCQQHYCLCILLRTFSGLPIPDLFASLSPSIPTSLSLYIYISSPLSFLANYLVHRSGSPAAAYPLSMSSLACNIFMCLSQALCFQRQQPGARPPPWVRPPASQNFWRRLPSLTVCSRSIRRSGLVLAKMLSRTSWTLSRRNRLHKRRRQ